MEAKTSGWISLAFTFRGELDGCDLVYGWVNDKSGVASLIDAHGTTEYRRQLRNDNRQFIKDESQDYQLIVGYQYQDSSVIRFKRKINTCDQDDLVITVIE